MKFSDEIYKFWLRPPATVAHQGQRRRFIRPPIFFLGLHADPSASWCSALVLVGFDAKPILRQAAARTNARTRAGESGRGPYKVFCFCFFSESSLVWFCFFFDFRFFYFEHIFQILANFNFGQILIQSKFLVR
jgi:hypothetical protein